MNTFHQKRMYKIILIISIVLLVLTSLIGAYGFYRVFKDDVFGNNIFEMFFFVFHIIFSILLIVLANGAIKKKPFILKALTIKNNMAINKVYTYGGIVVAVIGLALFVISGLQLINVLPKFFSFPIFLIVDIFNASMILMFVGLCFCLFPIAFRKDNISLFINNLKEKNNEKGN